MPLPASLYPCNPHWAYDIYHPPTKLREGNVCLSVTKRGGVPCDHSPWCIGPYHTGIPWPLYRDPMAMAPDPISVQRYPPQAPALPQRIWICSNLFNMDLTVQGHPPPQTCLTFSLWSTCVVRLASHWNAFLLKRVNWSCWSEFKKIQSHHHILVMICNCSHSLDLLCCAWVANLARIPGNLSKIWNHGKTSLCMCACVRVTSRLIKFQLIVTLLIPIKTFGWILRY